MRGDLIAAFERERLDLDALNCINTVIMSVFMYVCQNAYFVPVLTLLNVGYCILTVKSEASVGQNKASAFDAITLYIVVQVDA